MRHPWPMLPSPSDSVRPSEHSAQAIPALERMMLGLKASIAANPPDDPYLAEFADWESDAWG